MSKQQTAVEWLMEQITYDNGYGQRHNSFNDGVDLLEYFKQAKEMEDQQRGYSEEDLREAFKQSRQCKIFEKDMPPVYNEFEEWFEQFKK